jgi:TorA maturation chaperone TorD
MNAQAAPLKVTPPVFQEDQARADFYALIARLVHSGPDAWLLEAIAHADPILVEDNNLALAQAWNRLAAVARLLDTDAKVEAAQAEYDSVFVGTGKAEITPYASHYLAESMKERVLVRLRENLAEMGLARDPGVAEYEDHLAALCEVMRYLIAEGSGDAAVQKQKTFFLRYVAPWYAEFCAAAIASPNTDFYKHAAGFIKAFLDVEVESFEMV